MATSLANTTSTRADSASRHMLQCRVHKNRLLNWTKTRCDNNLLIQQKHKFCLAKDELAIEVSKVMDPGSDHLDRRAQPYPMVLSSFSGLGEEANTVYACLMHTTTPFSTHLDEIFKRIKAPSFQMKGSDHSIDDAAWTKVKTLPYFRTMGYSVGTAFAHENSGDTIASVMIGGISTVLNGEFPMHTGDRVMWYLTAAEKKMFAQDGKRAKDILLLKNPMAIPDDGSDKVPPFNYSDIKAFVDQIRSAAHAGVKKPLAQMAGKNRFHQNLIGVDLNNDSPSAKNEIALPKPFFHRNASDGDFERVFAVCIAPAGPFEMVDIMISRQSL